MSLNGASSQRHRQALLPAPFHTDYSSKITLCQKVEKYLVSRSPPSTTAEIEYCEGAINNKWPWYVERQSSLLLLFCVYIWCDSPTRQGLRILASLWMQYIFNLKFCAKQRGWVWVNRKQSSEIICELSARIAVALNASLEKPAIMSTKSGTNKGGLKAKP